MKSLDSSTLVIVDNLLIGLNVYLVDFFIDSCRSCDKVFRGGYIVVDGTDELPEERLTIVTGGFGIFEVFLVEFGFIICLKDIG